MRVGRREPITDPVVETTERERKVFWLLEPAEDLSEQMGAREREMDTCRPTCSTETLLYAYARSSLYHRPTKTLNPKEQLEDKAKAGGH